MIKVSSEVNIEQDKGVFVLAHVLSSDESTLINSYGFKSEDIINHVAIVDERLYIEGDSYEDVALHIVKSLTISDPPLNEMLNNDFSLLLDLVNIIREENRKQAHWKP